MKKILTLMAAMSAVTGAVANDFDWQSIPAKPATISQRMLLTWLKAAMACILWTIPSLSR